jgi:hypothetical protein
MKRSPMPPRRNGLSRRGRLRSQSEKRTERRASVQPVVDAVLARDGGCVLRNHRGAGDCSGQDTPHHLCKAWKGWDWTLDNLVALCAGHNGWVEDHPDDAFLLGLVIREGTTPAGAWLAMLMADLPVGEYVAECPGSGLPPLSERHGYGRCPACRMIPPLEHDPAGGALIAPHPWSPPR